MSNTKKESRIGNKNRKFILSLLIISFLSILIVKLFVEFILSKNDLLLFNIRFNTMLLTGFMILTCIIFILIFIFRIGLKKKNCFGRVLSVIIIITLILTISTIIMIKEENRYYHIINMNWNINLPREYKEIFYIDSGESFLGDGKRYSVFQYNTLDEINSTIEWKDKVDYIENYVVDILEELEVSKEYYPDFNSDFKYYYKMDEDKSKIYIILNRDLKEVYIVESFF